MKPDDPQLLEKLPPTYKLLEPASKEELAPITKLFVIVKLLNNCLVPGATVDEVVKLKKDPPLMV